MPRERGASAGVRPRRPRLAVALVSAVLLARAAAAAAGTAGATEPREASLAAAALAPSGRPLLVDLGGDEAATAATVDAHGRTLVAGTSQSGAHRDVVLVAVAPEGAVDRTFGAGGTVRLDAGAGAQIDALAVLDDAVVAVGHAGEPASGIALRLAPDGTPDAAFARRARAALLDAAGGRALALAPGADGALLVGGAVRRGDAWRASLTRLARDGQLDPTFGERGRALLPIAGADAAVRAVGQDQRGRIVVAGGGDGEAFVARLQPDGALDASFARDGVARLPLAGARVVAAVVAPDGSAVLVTRPASGEGASLVVRTDATGASDVRETGGGVRPLEFGGRAVQVRCIALDVLRGRIVLGASARTPDGERPLLLHLAADGTPSSAGFARTGPLDTVVATDAIDAPRASGTAGAAAAVDVAALAIVADGSVVAAGTAGAGAARDLALLRVAATRATCGDGTISTGEQCDDGPANGATGSCCTTSCTWRPAGTACRPAAGACDEAELCDGQSAHCPEDRVARAGAPCRAAAGACDVAEVCRGDSAECPANDVQPRGAVCRLAEGVCDLDEKCDGASSDCPADAKRVGECRASRGACDPAEWCDASGACPPDVRLPDGAACDDGDACTADDTCVADVCRGGARDDFACTGYLCAQMRERERLSGQPPPAGELRALGLDVRQLEPLASAVCVPAVTAADDPGTATPHAADLDAVDARDERSPYVVYRVEKGMAARSPQRPRRLASATLEDRFGLLDVVLGRVSMVSLAAAVGTIEEGAALPVGVPYQCQHVPRGTGLVPAARDVVVRALGESSTERFAVERPVRVCHPADATDVAAGAQQEEALLCYELRPLGTEIAALRATPLLAENRFERLLVTRLGKRQLCVPASLVSADWNEPQPRRSPGRDPDAKRPRRPQRGDRGDRGDRPRRPHRGPGHPRGDAAPVAP